MFRPYTWAIIRLWLDLSSGYTSMRVVVMGRKGVGSRSQYVTGYHGTMVPDVSGWKSFFLTYPFTPHDHYTHAGIT